MEGAGLYGLGGATQGRERQGIWSPEDLSCLGQLIPWSSSVMGFFILSCWVWRLGE